MASAIASIGSALRYDAAETILASGGSLAAAYAVAIEAAESIPADADCSPESFAYTHRAPEAVTVAPRKRAA